MILSIRKDPAFGSVSRVYSSKLRILFLDWQALKRSLFSITCIGRGKLTWKGKEIYPAGRHYVFYEGILWISVLEDNFFSRQLHCLQWCLYSMHCALLYGYITVKNKLRKCHFFCYIGNAWIEKWLSVERLAQPLLSRKINRVLKNERAPLAVISGFKITL